MQKITSPILRSGNTNTNNTCKREKEKQHHIITSKMVTKVRLGKIL